MAVQWPNMLLEKNPKTRPVLKRLLILEDSLLGKPFPQMKRVKEMSNYACGPAVLQMMLSFVGIKVTQIGIIKSLRAQKKIRLYGLNIGDLARAVRIAGKGRVFFWKKEKASIQDMIRIIEKFNFPVGVEWQGEFYENTDEDNGHYGVVTKVDRKGDYIRIADPYFNNYFHYEDVDRKFSLRVFFKKWWDENDVKVSGGSKTRKVKDIKMMFVITPKGASWPKKLGMKRA